MTPRPPPSDRDRRMARRCEDCAVCRRARATGKGPAFLFVKAVEGRLCPWCRAYERVHGVKAHQPLPKEP